VFERNAMLQKIDNNKITKKHKTEREREGVDNYNDEKNKIENDSYMCRLV
jgi:hypothetical protein